MFTDPNREALLAVADRLAPRLDEFLFVGGATVGLLITDPASRAPRPTKDVDVVVQVASLAEYSVALRRFLLERGLQERVDEESPVCRWVAGGVLVDVMPTDEQVLGFTNRWFGEAMQNAMVTEIGERSIHHASPPYFVATKLEAFSDRGRGDYYESEDLEDVLMLVEGRRELALELAGAAEGVRTFVGTEIRRLLANDDFLHALPGHVEPGNDERVMECLAALAEF